MKGGSAREPCVPEDDRHIERVFSRATFNESVSDMLSALAHTCYSPFY